MPWSVAVHDTEHPCGGMPVLTIVSFRHYCTHHQAWWARVELWAQDSDDVQVLATATREFGPFDSVADVVLWERSAVDGVVSDPRRPWAS